MYKSGRDAANETRAKWDWEAWRGESRLSYSENGGFGSEWILDNSLGAREIPKHTMQYRYIEVSTGGGKDSAC